MICKPEEIKELIERLGDGTYTIKIKKREVIAFRKEENYTEREAREILKKRAIDR